MKLSDLKVLEYGNFAGSGMASNVLPAGVYTTGPVDDPKSMRVVSDGTTATITGFVTSGYEGVMPWPNLWFRVGIGAYAFDAEYDLTGTLAIPAYITSIGEGNFYLCPVNPCYLELDASAVHNTAFAFSSILKIYYKPGTVGWTNPWNNIATEEWTSYPDPMP